jgi:hypothetical protein
MTLEDKVHNRTPVCYRGFYLNAHFKPEAWTLEFAYVFNVGAIRGAVSPCLARRGPTSRDSSFALRFFLKLPV